MTARADYRGVKFGRWTVDSWNDDDRKWVCVCDCGNRGLISSARLRSGVTASCGCLALELRTKHGHARKHGKRTTTYRAWYAMIQRTTNPNTKQFNDYGGRGIVACEEWRDFANFLKDMGERPSGLTLDRIDNDKGYSKENCRWATRHEQQLNRRCTRYLTVDGITKPLSVWAKERGLYTTLVRNRIVKGWPVGRALSVTVS